MPKKKKDSNQDPQSPDMTDSASPDKTEGLEEQKGPTQDIASPDVTDNLRYYVTALPKDVSQSEKMARLSELADVITNVANSDVFSISIWID